MLFFSLCQVDNEKKESIKKSIGERIRRLRVTLNQTQEQVAGIAGISIGTLRAIESGETLGVEFLIILADYYSMTPSELIDTEAPLPDASELKDRMTEYHTPQQHMILAALQEPPELKWALERLLEQGFLQEWKRVKDIRLKIKEDFKIDYRSSAISNALIKFMEDGRMIREKEDAKNYRYSSIITGPDQQVS